MTTQPMTHHKNRTITLLLTLTAWGYLAAQTPVDSLRMHVGYSSTDTRTASGAVDKVTQQRMNKGLVTNSLDALSGQAAGVQVQTGGNGEAMLTAVRVRGTTSLTGGNDPLVIIDSVQSDIATM